MKSCSIVHSVSIHPARTLEKVSTLISVLRTATALAVTASPGSRISTPNASVTDAGDWVSTGLAISSIGRASNANSLTGSTTTFIGTGPIGNSSPPTSQLLSQGSDLRSELWAVSSITILCMFIEVLICWF